MKIGTFDLKQDGVFIIAELSANHGHDIEIAKETIRAAKRAGADAVKLQTYTPDTITIDCQKPDFQIKGTVWDGRTLYELYQEAYLPWEWHQALFETAREAGLICFSSPFDRTAVDFLEKMAVPVYKIASFEITDVPLIAYVASKQKPVIISTGIATDEDISLAVNTCKAQGNNQIILLKTSSQYPADSSDANLLMIPDMARRFKVTTGLSDHTKGDLVPVIATTLGAKVIEKHIILNRKVGGPDADFSLDENEFRQMVKAVRQTEKALGSIDYGLSGKAQKSRAFARSLYVVKDIPKGQIITEDFVRSIRPGFGLHPKYLNEIIGKKANRDLEKGTRFRLEFLE